MRFSLRTKLLAIILVAGVLPLGLTGIWLAAGAERSGAEELRARLDESLLRTAQDIGARWVALRSRLLTLADSPELQAALLTADGRGQTEPRPWPVAEATPDGVADVTVRDLTGTARWHWNAGTAVPAATAVSRLQVFQRGTGRSIGELEAHVLTRTLLTARAGSIAGVGSEIGLIDRTSGAQLIPLPFDPELAADGRFSWAGEEWLAVSRRLDEPALDVIAAAALTPYLTPFRDARMRGLTALALVTAVACLAVIVLTSRTTRSLRRLSQAATAVSLGEFDRAVEATGGDEVAGLAAAFNTMTENLRQTMATLARRESAAAVGEFSASLAHEVRNPLTSIRLELQRLEERLPNDPKLRQSLERALHSVSRLDATVTGILRIARSGQLSLQDTDVRSVLDAVVAEIEAEARVHETTVACHHQSNGLRLRADQAALHQLFLNLILNGLQAAGRGGRVDVVAGRDDRGVVVDITDSGPGVPDTMRDRLFEPFATSKADGTGLGLPIARRIAVAHGGDVTIRSDATGGTTATVRLPAAPLDA